MRKRKWERRSSVVYEWTCLDVCTRNQKIKSLDYVRENKHKEGVFECDKCLCTRRRRRDRFLEELNGCIEACETQG